MARIVNRDLLPKIKWYWYPVSIMACIAGSPLLLGIWLSDHRLGREVFINLLTRLDPTGTLDDGVVEK